MEEEKAARSRLADLSLPPEVERLGNVPYFRRSERTTSGKMQIRKALLEKSPTQ
jgi:hypothetical protein